MYILKDEIILPSRYCGEGTSHDENEVNKAEKLTFAQEDALLCYKHKVDSPSFLYHTLLCRVPFSEQPESSVTPSTWANSECIVVEVLTSSGLQGRKCQLQSFLQKDQNELVVSY